MDVANSSHGAVKGTPSPFDWFFLGSLALALCGVMWIGVVAYEEGQKVETVKRHGEAWGQFFTSKTAARAQESFEPAACAAGAEAKTTWGGCYQALVAPGGALDGLKNPFSLAPQKVTSCKFGGLGTAGELMLEKLVSTPPGAPVPFIAEPLLETDAIHQKMHIRVTICDKGGNPIRVGEFDF